MTKRSPRWCWPLPGSAMCAPRPTGCSMRRSTPRLSRRCPSVVVQQFRLRPDTSLEPAPPLPPLPAAARRAAQAAGLTDSRIAANIDRGFCSKNRSAAVVPSGRVSRKLCTAVRHARFRGWSSPRSSWFRSERYPLVLPHWNWSAGTPPRVWLLPASAGLAHPDSTHMTVRVRVLCPAASATRCRCKDRGQGSLH
jgi:hypothetical protein